MSARTLRAVKILAVFFMIPLLGAILVYSWINRIADQRWAAAESRIRQLSAAFPEGDSRREPENKSEAAKENQIHLVAAIRLAAPKRLQRDEAFRLVGQRKPGEALEPVLDDAQDFLDRLRQGARRIAAAPADFPPRWHGDWDYVTLNYMMYCGVLRSRHQRWRKAPLDAAETLLDLLQLGRFWAISGNGFNRNYSLENIAQPLEELRDLISSESLSPDDLRRVERELEQIDAAMQSPLRDLEPWLARWGEDLASADLKDNGVMAGAPYRWRYLLPGRMMKAEAFEFATRNVERLLECEKLGYAETRNQSFGIFSEANRSRNPIIRRLAALGENLGWIELERKAQVRLLRVAAHYRATGDLLKLEDPYGDLIHGADSGTQMKFWSRGSNGMDDAGDNGGHTWWIRPPATAGAAPAKDLVIEVPRRP